MKKRNVLLVGGLMAVLACGAQQINPLTMAVINSYTELISANPNDYMSYLQRGQEYLNLGDMQKAEEDLLNALKCTPEKETDLRSQEYSLLSDIYLTRGENEKALDALTTALKADPNSYAIRYKLGRLYLTLDRPDDAYRTFQGLQNLKSRSQEAYYGMAQAAARLGKTQEAVDLIEQIKNADQNSFVTYLRIGNVYEDLNQNDKAAANYLRSYSLSNKNSSPLDALMALASKDYQAVASALDSNIKAAPTNIMLHYLKSFVALENGNYNDAIREGNELLLLPDGQDASVYRLLAISYQALGNQSAALESINKAAAMDPNDPLVLIEQIDMTMNSDPKAAAAIADKALTANGSNLDLMMEAAKANIMARNGEKARDILNTIVMTDPSNVESLVLRGYVNTELLDDAKTGINDYTRASNIDAADNYNKIYKALAKVKAGKAMDADSIITGIANSDPDAQTLYYLAAYYAQTGNLEKAKETADKAVAKGYSNVFNLKQNKAPMLNLQPIHHLF